MNMTLPVRLEGYHVELPFSCIYSYDWSLMWFCANGVENCEIKNWATYKTLQLIMISRGFVWLILTNFVVPFIWNVFFICLVVFIWRINCFDWSCTFLIFSLYFLIIVRQIFRLLYHLSWCHKSFSNKSTKW